MDLKFDYPKITSKIIKSVDDCIKVGCELEKLACDVSNRKVFKCFFRGDKADAVLCSHFMQRKDFVKREHLVFEDWIKENPCYDQNDFISLAIQQHYCDNTKKGTRLLDFSQDILVALRFACGRTDNPNSDAKITVDISQYDEKQSARAADALLKLVKQPEIIDLSAFDKDELNSIKGDYFYVIDSSMERIVRQKGCFLLFGNLTDEELKTGKIRVHKTKKVHCLSENIGRGEDYPGYIGTIHVDPGSIDSILKELERSKSYNIDYLMEKDK